MKLYRTALYMRLSREDGDKEESDSIVNQRTLLQGFLRDKPELKQVREYVDDGYSGSTFERPAFARMMEDVKKGVINCIVVKDLSRFGRNYIESGKYLERIFPFMGVRFIAVNDGYDDVNETEGGDAILLPIRNVINDAYCRDISVKIRSQLAAKRERGEFVGNLAAYGYRRDAQNRGVLVVDEEAAKVVRQIFAWKLEGMSGGKIAERLNQQGILSPLEYRKACGGHASESFRKHEQAKWSAKAVVRILENEVYIGNLLQGKTAKQDYRSKEIRRLPREQWVRAEHTHEPIIEKSVFRQAQLLMAREGKALRGKDTVALFAGFLECADCGQPMVRRVVTHPDRQYRYYVCRRYKAGEGCASHSVREDALYQQVLWEIGEAARTACANRTDAEKRRFSRIQKLGNRIFYIPAAREQEQRFREKAYQDYTEGLIGEAEYLEYIRLYEKRRKRRRSRHRMQEAQKRKVDRIRSERQRQALLCRYVSLDHLNRAVLAELVEKIVIDQNRRIKIQFRYPKAEG